MADKTVKQKDKSDYLSFIRRSKYVIKEGIFYVGDNREYEVVIKDLKRNPLLEDETQKLIKIFFNDLRSHSLEDIFKSANEFIVIILNRKVLIRKSQYNGNNKQVLKKIN